MAARTIFCSRNTVPEGTRTRVPACDSSAWMTSSELVSTCKFIPAICEHICSVVVPAPSMIASPGRHKSAPRWPTA